MTYRIARALRACPVLLLMAVPTLVAGQQTAKKTSLEFTRQGLLVVNFKPATGTDLKTGRRTADAVRDRVGKLVDKRETYVVSGDEIELRMTIAGFDANGTYSLEDIHTMAKYFRADEYLLGYVQSGPEGVQLWGDLVMMRDERLRQPLPRVRAARMDSAVAQFSRAIAAARPQLIPQRRCENALREVRGAEAVQAARVGVATYSRSTVARTCLVWALRQSGAPATEILSVAQEVLAIDSGSFHAMEGAAIALDSLKRRDAAASMWLRLAATDTADLELSLRVVYALIDGQNAKRAEPFVSALASAHPDDIRFTQQKWRAAYENRSWAHAIEAGEVMLARDDLARADSTFYLKLGTAYRAANKTFKAVETVAHAVSAFPGDSRLYSQYTQYVKSEADSVIPRGLALYPRNADLIAMNARELRTKGKIAESLDATRRAMAIDSSMAHGQLVVAQLELELGRPDSALASLRQATSTGEDSVSVAQFALSKGNAFYRAATASKLSQDFGLAIRFLSYADTMHTSTQSRFLVGAASLGMAQAVLTEATKLKEKSESCRLAQLGAEMMPIARAGLEAGQEAYAEAAKQSLDYLAQLDPFVTQQLKVYCGVSTP